MSLWLVRPTRFELASPRLKVGGSRPIKLRAVITPVPLDFLCVSSSSLLVFGKIVPIEDFLEAARLLLSALFMRKDACRFGIKVNWFAVLALLRKAPVNGAPGRTRTCNILFLRQARLPIAPLGQAWCALSDSNRHWPSLKLGASSVWAKRALRRFAFHWN